MRSIQKAVIEPCFSLPCFRARHHATGAAHRAPCQALLCRDCKPQVRSSRSRRGGLLLKSACARSARSLVRASALSSSFEYRTGYTGRFVCCYCTPQSCAERDPGSTRGQVFLARRHSLQVPLVLACWWDVLTLLKCAG